MMLSLFVTSFAEVPQMINFQGALKDANGLPVNSSVDLTFRIYDMETGGTPAWEELHIAVPVNDGIFNAELGGFVPFPYDLLDNPELWITFRVSGEVDEMSPRKRILSVPYSRMSEKSKHSTNSDTTSTISGVPISGLVQQDGSGNVNISGAMTATAFIGDGSGLTGITSIYDTTFIHSTGPDTMTANTSGATLTIKNANPSNGDAIKINGGYQGIRIDSVTTGIYVLDADYNGIAVGTADNQGMSVFSSGAEGVYVQTAGTDGFKVYNAGTPSTQLASSYKNGFEVAGAEGNGLYVGQADNMGVEVGYAAYSGFVVQSAGDDGVAVVSAGDNGVFVNSSGSDGFYISYAGNDGFSSANAVDDGGDFWASDDGVYAQTSDTNDEWGFNTPDKIQGSNITTRTINNIGLNTGSEELENGDIVCLTGYIDESVADSDIPIIKVEKANRNNSAAVIGIVEYKVYEREEADEKDGKTVYTRSFRFAEGNAHRGEYVSIIIVGPADVKVDSRENIKIGQKLTVSGNTGKARSIQESDNWTIGILGKALENSSGKGKIKVYVNCK